MNKPKVAILCDPIDNQKAGIHMYTKAVVKQLMATPQEYEFIYIHIQKNSFFRDSKNYVVPDFRYLPGWSSFRLFILIPILLRLLKVKAVWEPAHFGPFGLPKSIKRITTIHDMTPVLMPQYHTFVGAFLHKLFLRRILKKADLIIADSNSTKEDIHSYEPSTKNKTKVVYLATDLKPDDTKIDLNQYGIKLPYFLYVGTIEPRKNIITLVKAFEEFSAKSQTAHQLILVGQMGWKSESLLEQIKNSPYAKKIIMPGYVPREHLAQLYKASTAFVYPSLYEGFGLPVLEALTCETACLTTKVSSIPEVAEKAAVYFEPKSPLDLSAKMLEITQKPAFRAQVIKAGLIQADKFSWSVTTKQILNCFKSLIEG